MLAAASAPPGAAGGALDTPCCGLDRHLQVYAARELARAAAAPAGTDPAQVAAPADGRRDATPPAQIGAGDQGTGAAITDPFITARVKIEFQRRSQLRDLKVDVQTRNGTVELSGVVEDAAQAELAVRTAGEVEGVKSVKNALEVRR
ncbi:MAG: BON domain-containing protein [Pseudomonadota bacterium]